MDRRAQLAQSVLTGSDGWLFHRDHAAIEQVTGARPFSDYELRMWRLLIEMRRHWIEAHGGRYYVYVIPEKHVVYADKLGSGLDISDRRPALQLASALGAHASGIDVLYPLGALQAARSTRETYFINDTHWNMYGGYVGYRALYDELSKHHAMIDVQESRLRHYSKEHEGDLGVRLEPERLDPDLFHVLNDAQARIVGENKIFDRGRVVVWEQPNRSLARVVVFRDSFANYFLHLLAESVTRVVAVSSMEVFFDLLESERPDIVITQIAERFLNNPVSPDGDAHFPDDLRAPPFETLCRMTCEEVRACRIAEGT